MTEATSQPINQLLSSSCDQPLSGMARQGAMGVEEIIRKKVTSIRRWKMTKLGKRSNRWAFEFTVMTYNILSQNAIENHKYLYRNCGPRFLEEEYRISKIMPEILKTKSDVICLQEVEEQLFDNRIKKVFHSNGFESVFKKRTGCKSDGCAILWRRAKFHLLAHKDVDFRTNNCKIMDRDNVGLIAVLKPKHPASSSLRLHVATTHLLFNPRRGDIKLCQLRMLLAELESMALKKVTEKGRLYHPVILCGDFNFEPHSPLYQFIDNGRLDVMNTISGDLSGQAEGRNKGRHVVGEHLSLHDLGINRAGRFQAELSESSAPGSPLKTADYELPEENEAKKKSNDYSPSPSHSKSEQTSTTAIGNGCLVNAKWLAEVEASKNPQWIAAIRALTNMPQGSAGSSHVSDSPVDLKNMSHTSALESEANKSDTASSSSSEGVGHCFYHDFHFVPTYKYYNQEKTKPLVTSMTGDDFGTVDHIFYNVKVKKSWNSYTEDKLKLLGWYSLLNANDLIEIGGLPNAYFGSDHICLISKFALNFK